MNGEINSGPKNAQPLVTSQDQEITTLNLSDLEFNSEILAKLQQLQENAERIGMKIFCWNGWFIVTHDPSAIRQSLSTLENIDNFQEMIDPYKLWGMCIYVHKAAELHEIADSSLYAQKMNCVSTSIYPVNSIHYIAVKDEGEFSIYFDLTSRVYVFFDQEHERESPAKGIMVIDKIDEMAGIEAIYGREWRRTKLEEEHGYREHIQELFNNMKISDK